jgi:vacuolar-type H+-ATPase subunit I/STV1
LEEIMSSRTAFLGKLLGLYYIAVSLAMFVHPQATAEIVKGIVENPPLLFIVGLIGLTTGLAIVLAHNVWSGGALPIIVTLVGWAILIKGTLLMILSPETESRIFIAGHYEQHPNLYATFVLLLGAYLTYAGFSSATRLIK